MELTPEAETTQYSVERLEELFGEYEEARRSVHTVFGGVVLRGEWAQFPHRNLTRLRNQICQCITKMDDLSFDERVMCLRQVGMCIDTPSERWILDKLGATKGGEFVYGRNKFTMSSPPTLSLQYVEDLEKAVVSLLCETETTSGERVYSSGVVGDWEDPKTPLLTIR